MKERLRIQGLRKRWILNSVGPVILILVLAAILASATVANNYYGSARSTLEAKAKAGADYFNYLQHEQLQRVLPQRLTVRRQLRQHPHRAAIPESLRPGG